MQSRPEDPVELCKDSSLLGVKQKNYCRVLSRAEQFFSNLDLNRITPAAVRTAEHTRTEAEVGAGNDPTLSY